MVKEVKIKIQKFDPEKDDKPYFKEYTVPYHKTMRILDAIKYIQESLDGTLAYRWNCSMGICGSCAMEINGVPVLTCKTELKPNLLGIRISPLKAFPIIKDLVPDYSPVFDREKRMKLFFVSDNPKGEFLRMKNDEIKEVRKFRSCIECMICCDSCRPYRDGNVDFLGPKSIVKAMAYDLHPRDNLNRKKILEDEGLWNCNTTRCCQNSCPQGITITDEGIIPVQEGKNKELKEKSFIK